MLDEYHQMLVGFINAETGKSLETIEDFGHLELLQELGPELRKFNTKMNCRKILVRIQIYQNTVGLKLKLFYTIFLCKPVLNF